MAQTVQPPRFGAGHQPENPKNSGRGLTKLLDLAVVSHTRAVALLVLCGFLFFLPGFFSIPPIDRDEARFVQATKQMVETNDFVDIRYQDEVRYKKPVGIYWLQSAVVETAAALGVPRAQLRIWLYRVPSLIGAIGAVLLTYWTALAFVTRRGALLAALVMCSSLLLGVEARLAKTDAMLLLTSLAAMGAMGRTYVAWQRGDGPDSSWLLPAVFWTAIAGGILIKGPVILMFVGLAAVVLAVLDRSAGWLWRLRPISGCVWLLLLVLPWFVAIFWRSGDSFFTTAVGGDMLNKIAQGQESHGAPPGYYFATFWVTFWPGSALAAMATPAIWRARREPGAQFLLAWLIPSWIVFELIVTKLPHYTLPLFPAAAILIVGALERRVLSRASWLTRGASWWFALPLIVCVAAIVGAIYLIRQPEFLAWPFAAGALIFGLFAWWMFDQNRAERSLLNAVVASWFVSVAVFGVVFPSMTPLFPSVEIARAIRQVECVGPRIAAAGYHEPSLVFMTATSTLLTDGSRAADFLSQGACRFAVIEYRQERAFTQRAETIGLRYRAGAKIDGYNFSQGRRVSIAIFHSEGTR
ncbi:MAG: glycosyl transferase [Proteobacteria bacterium SG_bin9]|nr:MAG: glycosyl transferase [Proteobacteria bacterium SG_bin9]